MNIYTTAWNVAIKQPGEKTYKIIPTGYNFWAADPFLFYFDNKIYVFAELWFYKENQGAIGYYSFSDEKPQWKIIIKESYHLSYPHLFEFDNEIYMCPEANESNTITLYKAVLFPNKWIKLTHLKTDLKAVDTTFFNYNNDMYCFTYLLNVQELHIYKVNTNDNFSLKSFCYNPITSDLSLARMAGNIIKNNNQYIRVSQNCSKLYGESLMFSSFKVEINGYKETFIKRMNVSDFNINNKKKYFGVHTYNSLNGYEIIDLKYKIISPYDIFYKASRKIRRLFHE